MTEPAIAELLEALPCAAALFDDSLRLTVANVSFARLVGASIDDLRGRTLRDALPVAGDLGAACAGVAKGRVEVVRSAVVISGMLHRRVDLTYAPLRPATAPRGGLLLTAVDATDRDGARATGVDDRTRELLALQEERAHERRLAAVGQLAAGVMHDVNNALNPIMAAAFLLEANADNPESVRDYARRIAKAAETGAATASRVGRFIRQEPPQDPRGAPVVLADLVDEVTAMTRPMWAERSGGGIVQYTPELDREARVRGDAGELREALLNLVQNALDAMPDGGRLTIRTESSERETILEVSDSGIGMESEVRARAFDPFFSTKGAGGSGLGLAEVYGIVRRHRGHAEIDSVPGRGTTVRLRFPRVDDDVTLPTEPPTAREPRRVLLVEDHADGRDFMHTVLAMDGHTVDAVGTLADARERLGLDVANDSAERPFDVVVTDIGLPDGNGWQLIARVRARWPDMRFGVVTGWESAPPAGAVPDFTLRKPVRPAELLARVGSSG